MASNSHTEPNTSGFVIVSVLTNASVVVVARAASVGIQFISTVILARLLTPEDYGVFSIAVGAAALFYALRMFGTGNYLVVAHQLDDEMVGSAFTVTFALSAFFALILALSSPFLAIYYDSASLKPTLLIIAVGFLVNPFATISQSLLYREERIKIIVYIQLVAAVLSSIVSIALGFLGAGPLSLAVGALAGTTFVIIGNLLARPKFQTFKISVKHWRNVLTFGGWLTGVSMATQFSENSTGLILGKTVGVEEAGIFEKGNAAAKLPHSLFGSVIQTVFLAAIAREEREGVDASANYLFRISVLTSLVWPVFVFLALNGHAVVLVLFGPQWSDAGIVASIMAMTWFLMSPVLLGDQVLIARESVRLLFQMRLWLLVGRVAALILASPFGLAAASAAFFVPSVLYAAANQKYVSREIGITLHELISNLKGSFMIAVAAFLSNVLTVSIFGYKDHQYLISQIVVGVVATFTIWLIMTSIMDHPVNSIRNRVIAGVRKHVQG